MKYVAIAAAVLGLAAINTAGTAKAEDFGVTIRAGENHDTGGIVVTGAAIMPARPLPDRSHASHQRPRRPGDVPQEVLRLIANAKGAAGRAAAAAAFY